MMCNIDKIIEELKHNKNLPKMADWARKNPSWLKENLESMQKGNPNTSVESIISILESDMP